MRPKICALIPALLFLLLASSLIKADIHPDLADGYHELMIAARRPSPAWDGILLDQKGTLRRISEFSGRARLVLFFREPVHVLEEHFSILSGFAFAMTTNRCSALAITDLPVSNIGMPFIHGTNTNGQRPVLLQDPLSETFRRYGIRRTPCWLVITTNDIIIGEAHGLRHWTNAVHLFRSLSLINPTNAGRTNSGTTNTSITNSPSLRPETRSNSAIGVLRNMDNQSLFY